MTCGRIVEHEADAGTYRLPGEHAAWLTRAAAPNNLAAIMQWVAVLGTVESEVADAFRHGRGVPYSAYERFGEVMAEESGQSVVAGLEAHVLPLVEGLRDRLNDGIDVLDVGCGRGQALMHLAGRFPNSRFVGYDFLEEAVAAARAEAARRGLRNVRFERRDAAEMSDAAAFDLVTTFDAVHDQARPAAVLANIRRALRGPGGVYLCQEIKGESDHAANLDHPLAPFLYTISTMHCMSVSLANGGPGLGAMWGRRLCRQMLADAGFDDVVMNELAHDIQNDWYVCRAPATPSMAAA
jgi:SAM-dependent methyltransferase